MFWYNLTVPITLTGSIVNLKTALESAVGVPLEGFYRSDVQNRTGSDLFVSVGNSTPSSTNDMHLIQDKNIFALFTELGRIWVGGTGSVIVSIAKGGYSP